MAFAASAAAQTTIPFCSAAGVPAALHAEGIAEKAGDIVLSCTGGTAGQQISGNLTISTPVNITNRLIGSTVSDAAIFLDTGTGPQRLAAVGQLIGPQQLAFNNVVFTLTGSPSFTLKITNIRIAAAQSSSRQILAFISFNGLQLPTQNSTVTIGVPQTGLLASYATGGITCVGSPLPTTITFANLVAAGTQFASTRFTEGFATSFLTRAVDGADTGTRFIVRYSNFPAGARLFVPSVVAGSDATQPTAAGDLGGFPSGGAYTPGGTGSLVLSYVAGANDDGIGGSPVFLPNPASGTVAFNAMTEIPMASGSGWAVYEVVDSNSAQIESAQFPTFIGLSPANVVPTVAQEQVALAPLSLNFTASATEPIPRFSPTAPGSDCSTVGDCGAGYRPMLDVFAEPISFTAIQGGAAFDRPGYIAIKNTGGGIMPWTARVQYLNGSGWLVLDTTAGLNNGSVQVFARPQALTAGTYNANVIIDTGASAGSVSVPVTLIVRPFPGPLPPTAAQSPQIGSVSNGASFQPAPVAVGSVVTIKGLNLTGKSVDVTFDGISSPISYNDQYQINTIVPTSLAGKTFADVVVTVDGVKSLAFRVDLVPLAPAIFSNGVLNENGTANTPTNPIPTGHVVQVFATGLPSTAGNTIVKIHDRDNLTPLYSGGAPGVNGIEQVNVLVPNDLPSMTTDLLVCGFDQSGKKYCSAPFRLTIQAQE